MEEMYSEEAQRMNETRLGSAEPSHPKMMG